MWVEKVVMMLMDLIICLALRRKIGDLYFLIQVNECLFIYDSIDLLSSVLLEFYGFN